MCLFNRFACDEPTINVRYGDHINFFCPNYDINPMATTKHEGFSENLYAVTDETQYKNCDASGKRKFEMQFYFETPLQAFFNNSVKLIFYF